MIELKLIWSILINCASITKNVLTYHWTLRSYRHFKKAFFGKGYNVSMEYNNIVAAGECCLDRYAGEPKVWPGGITFNFAMNAANAFSGKNIHLISALGLRDETLFVKKLNSRGVKHKLTIVRETPSIGIHLDQKGEREFYGYDPGGLLDWYPSESQLRVIKDADLLVLTRYEAISSLFKRLINVPTKATRVVDFADISGKGLSEVKVMLANHDLADICIFGLSPDEGDLRNYLQGLANDHSGLFIITLAHKGAIALLQGKTWYQPAFPVTNVVDTTGAGDCFAAYFLSRWCSTGSIAEALEAGCFAASEIIQKRGAN